MFIFKMLKIADITRKIEQIKGLIHDEDITEEEGLTRIKARIDDLIKPQSSTIDFWTKILMSFVWVSLGFTGIIATYRV